MTRKKTPAPPLSADDGSDPQSGGISSALREEAPELFRVVASFLAEHGMSAAEIDAAYAAGRSGSVAAHSGSIWVQLGEAAAHWWRELEYLTPRGLPRALPECGPEPSIEGLLSRYVDRTHLERAKQILRDSVIVRADGRWQVRNEVRGVRVVGYESVGRLRVNVAGLLRTFTTNRSLRKAGGVGNIDLSATHPAFPTARLPELRERIRQIAATCADDADGTLRRTARGGTGPFSEVGLTLYLYDFPRG
jgi:hypothetical protein